MYYLGALLLFIIGLAHSVLGERYILIRLFKYHDLPKLFGGTEFTKHTLRFAWHLTTIAWFGFAFILLHLANLSVNSSIIGNIIGITFLIHFGVALLSSRGKHFSWVFFLFIGAATIYASNT